jgi:predicted nucleotidyltransferase
MIILHKEAFIMLAHDRICSAIRDAASQYPIKSAAYFGSYADGTQTESSDLDILLEFFTPEISLIILSEIKIRLEEALGVPVDLLHAPIPKKSLLKIGRVVQAFGE